MDGVVLQHSLSSLQDIAPYAPIDYAALAEQLQSGDLMMGAASGRTNAFLEGAWDGTPAADGDFPPVRPHQPFTLVPPP